MTEKRLGRHQHSNASFSHLSNIRAIVRRAEDAAVYIKSFVESMGWKLDFEAMNHRRCILIPDNHPFRLIQPFIKTVSSDHAYDDDTSSTTSSSDDR